MEMNDYQKRAAETDLLKGAVKTGGEYRVMGEGVGGEGKVGELYMAKILGLVGEAGEVAEKYKKIIRDKGGVVNLEDREEIVKELGDVMWYVATLARYLEVDLAVVAERNLAKLSSRKERKVIQGAGDNR